MPAQRPAKQNSLTAHLAEQAKARPVNSALSLSKYFTSADLLIRQADSYRRENNEEQQYVMLMRFASLLLETIPGHKDFSKQDPKYTRLKKVLVEASFPQLEALKLSLRAKEIVDPTAHSRNRPADAVMLATSNLPGINWGDAPAAATAPSGYDPASVRVDDLLDIIQHGPGPSAPPPPPPSAPPVPSAMSAPELPVYQPKYTSTSNSRHALFMSNASLPPAGVSQGSTAPGRAPSLPRYAQASNLLLEAGRTSSSGATAPAAPLPRYPGLDALAQMSIAGRLPPTAGPALGPQQVEVISVQPDVTGRPHTCSAPPGQLPSPPMLPQATQQQPATAPQATPGGPRELEKRTALRDVHVSVALMEEFLAYARANTGRGIESCGILAGRLSANDSIFTICTLIIPKQQGTTDTVQALNEEEIFEVQFSQELYPLGWIHTHPTQSCFLSSVDVHTQCGYQTMLDEAVAIVMAPTDRTKKCGIFRLSTPGGLQLVQRCNLRGFHPHPDTPTGQDLYELCGHVFLNPRTKHNVVDLR